MARYRVTNICTSEEQLAEIVNAYSQFDEFVFDVETRGEWRGKPHLAQVTWLSLAGPGRADVIPMGHINGRMLVPPRIERVMRRNEDGTAALNSQGRRQFDVSTHPPTFDDPPKQLWPSKVFAALEPIFFSDKRKIGHNVRFDLTAVAKYYDGRVPPPPYGDTIVLTHLLNENLGSYRLDFVIDRVFGLKYSDGKLGKTGIDMYSYWAVAKYAALDSYYAWLLWKNYFPNIEKQKLTEVFDLEMRVLEALIYMEWEGALIDVEMMDDLRERVNVRIDTIKEKLYGDVGQVWNLDNPLEKGHYVYNVRGHKPRHFTEKKNQPSTRSIHLEEFKGRDPMVGLLVEYAELAKLRSTYIDGMSEHLVMGKLHPSFLQSGTATGRFSCASPNLQNLPRETEDRKDLSVRSLFVAPEGHSLIVADYSQIEYRLFAHFSKDPYMIASFNAGIDAHTSMACMILGKPPEELTSEERTTYGKIVNFALGFSAGPQTLANQAGISLTKAREIMAAHRNASPRFYAWKDWEIQRAKRRKPPHVRTLSGRKRRLPTLFSEDDGTRWHAERQAINTIIQGSAADIMKLAIVRAHEAFRDTPVQPILTVHDELVTVCPEGMENEVVEEIRTAMEGAVELRLPLVADIKVCKRWSEGK